MITSVGEPVVSGEQRIKMSYAGDARSLSR